MSEQFRARGSHSARPARRPAQAPQGAALSCARATALLNHYVDGRLPASRLRLLETHLASCAACREELRHLEAVGRAVADTRLAAEPPDLTHRILARVAAFERARILTQARRFSLRWADARLAALLATLTTLFFILCDAQLRLSAGVSFAQTFPAVTALVMRASGSVGAALPWVVWVAAGSAVSITLVGGEVRRSWRRALLERLP